MAWPDFDVVGESEQLRADGMEKRLGGAAGEIRPAIGALEKRVAGEQPFFLFEIETDAARRMSRCFNDFIWMVRQLGRRVHWLRKIFGGGQPWEDGVVRTEIHGAIRLMNPYGQVEGRRHGTDAANVIDMCMRQQDAYRLGLDELDEDVLEGEVHALELEDGVARLGQRLEHGLSDVDVGPGLDEEVVAPLLGLDGRVGVLDALDAAEDAPDALARARDADGQLPVARDEGGEVVRPVVGDDLAVID